MNVRYHARAAIALAAAYVVALQAVLLAFGAPVAGAGGFAALPICASTAAGHSAPIGHEQGHGQGHGQDCLDACLTGCCCGAPILPAAARAAVNVPAPMHALAVARHTGAPFVASFTNAHRSRAPPAA
jgi:hypothetical protein